MEPSGRSWEAEQLDRQPALRRRIDGSPEFQRWLEELPSIEIDGERLYLAWGDVPMDHDQVAYVWAREEGLIEPDPGGAAPT